MLLFLPPTSPSTSSQPFPCLWLRLIFQALSRHTTAFATATAIKFFFFFLSCLYFGACRAWTKPTLSWKTNGWLSYSAAWCINSRMKNPARSTILNQRKWFRKTFGGYQIFQLIMYKYKKKFLSKVTQNLSHKFLTEDMFCI